MEGKFSPLDCLAALVRHLTSIVSAEFRPMVRGLLEGGDKPAALESLATLATFHALTDGKELRRWLELNSRADVADRFFTRLKDVELAAQDSFELLVDAADAGRFQRSREYIEGRLYSAESEWDRVRRVALDAGEFVGDVFRQVRQRLFVPSVMQDRILGALYGKAMKKLRLRAELRCGSYADLYKSGGPGGLTQLLDYGLVKSDRKMGGYYRPDAPPERKRTKSVP